MAGARRIGTTRPHHHRAAAWPVADNSAAGLGGGVSDVRQVVFEMWQVGVSDVRQVFAQPASHVRQTVSSLICVYMGLFFPVLYINGRQVMGTIKNALAKYDAEHEFLRQLTIPEEDRSKHTAAKWSGEYRWFRSVNIICLEKVRRLRAVAAAGETASSDPNVADD